MTSLFPDGAENVEEYEYKVHFVLSNGLVICGTKSAKEGTEDKEKVTCKICLKALERGDDIEERGNIPLSLTLTVTTESPPITRGRGKQLLIAWLNQLPDDVSLDFKSSYGSSPIFIASWKETRE